MNRKYLIFIVLILCLFTWSCSDEPQNKCNMEGEVIAYVYDKCGCCPGWQVVLGNDTLKFETVPENDYLWTLVNCLGFPQNITFSYESTVDECAYAYHKMTCISYEIDLSSTYIYCDSNCLTQSDLDSDLNLDNKWDFLGIYHENDGYQECYLIEENPIYISIDTSGEFSGQCACNIYSGQMIVGSSESIEINELIQTEMYCQDSLIWDWEIKYFDYLLNVHSYNLIGQQLWLNSSNNMVLVYGLSSSE